MRTWVGCLCVLGGLQLAACGGGAASTDPTTTATAAATADETTSPGLSFDVAPVSVRVIEPGSMPRFALRVARPEGLTADGAGSSSTSITIGIDGHEQVSVLPTQTMNLRYTSGPIDPATGGQLAVAELRSIELAEEEGVDPEVLRESRAALARLRGLRVDLSMTPLGATTRVVIHSPDVSEVERDFFEALARSLSSLGSVLPEEQVGLGASWQSTQNTDLFGIDLEIVSTYTVREIDADHVVLGTVIGVASRGGRPTLPGLPPEVEFRLDELDGGGEGTVSMHLRSWRQETNLSQRIRAVMSAENREGTRRSMSITQTMRASVHVD
jgi:hypothetical protein